MKAPHSLEAVSAVVLVTLGFFGMTGPAAVSGCAGDVEPVPSSTHRAVEESEESNGLSPLVVDIEAPLLLEEPPSQELMREASVQQLANNQSCLHCHANYDREPLVSWHAAGGIACADCHGQSDAHQNDENNVTPPDIMYPADEIDRSCQECHTTHDAPAVEVLARWKQCCQETTDLEEVICTDCHGAHRLKLRTVRWDKKTGKLVRLEDR